MFYLLEGAVPSVLRPLHSLFSFLFLSHLCPFRFFPSLRSWLARYLSWFLAGLRAFFWLRIFPSLVPFSFVPGSLILFFSLLSEGLFTSPSFFTPPDLPLCIYIRIIMSG